MLTRMVLSRRVRALAVVAFFLVLSSASTVAQTTQFTYQGKLSNNASPANGQYDFQFKLFDTPSLGTGTQFGFTITVPNVTVTAGIFTAQIDFGLCVSCFNGTPRFLEIAVKLAGDPTFTTVGPRQQITSSPYALKSANAATSDGLSVACVNCITSSQIGSVNGSALTGTIPVSSVPPGSVNYIQNTMSLQASSNFNIGGNGTANIFDAATQYNLGGSRVLALGNNNIFVGLTTGQNITTGAFNAFFGNGAGSSNTVGISNTFLGTLAGTANLGGVDNAFVGSQAGGG